MRVTETVGNKLNEEGTLTKTLKRALHHRPARWRIHRTLYLLHSDRK